MRQLDAQAALLLHVATVAPTFLDRDKSVLSVDDTLEAAINECVVKVTSEYCKR